MTVAILAGVGFAGGFLMLIRVLHPRVASLETLIGTVSGAAEGGAAIAGTGGSDDASNARSPSTNGTIELVRLAIAERTAYYLRFTPIETPALRADLAITGMSFEELAGEIAIVGLGAGAVIPLASLVMDLGGITVPFAIPALASLIAAVGGACLPFLSLRSRSAEMRRRFRRALATFLELVSLAMAGAMGVEGALEGAASISDDWTMRRIRSAIASARHRGEPPWQALSSLGEEIGVPELTELAANLGLAGSEGARVRDTLSSKAATLRRRELAESEAEANSTTEKMFVPGVLLLAGFMVFVGYPAVAHVFHTL